jgi:hypothetical protein
MTIANELITGIINSTNLTATTATLPNIVATNISTSTINVTSSTTGSGLFTNLTATNIIVTNLTAPSLAVTNFITTNSTFTNLLSTNTTIPNLSSNSITTNNLLVTGSTQNIVYIDSQGSQVNYAKIVFKNSGGTGDFKITGDGGDIQWQGGGGRALQMGAFHEVRLLGGRNTTVDIPFVNGSTTTFNTIIQNTNDSIALRVQANSTQTVNLQEWTNNSGTVLSRIDALGNLQITSTAAAVSNSTGSFITGGGGGFDGDVYANNFFSYQGTTTANSLVYGSNFNYVNSTASSAISSTTASVKLTMTTGNLVAGTYLVQPSYKIRVNTATRTGITELYQTNTNGTLIHSSGVSCPTVATDFVYQTDNVVLVLGAGVQTFVLRYRCTLSTYTTTIADARLIVYRVL